MPTLSELKVSSTDINVLVSAFPLDSSKSLSDYVPEDWIDLDGPPLNVDILSVPPHIVREVCDVMNDAGEEFLKEYHSNIVEQALAAVPEDAKKRH